MILIDTSVLIDYFRGNENSQALLLAEILARDIPFGLSAFTVQELLQGARNEREFAMLDNYLSSQKIYYLPNEIETYRQAAKIYFELRRKGITVRSSIDVLIALTSIHFKLSLLHNDNDFEVIAEGLNELQILRSL